MNNKIVNKYSGFDSLQESMNVLDDAVLVEENEVNEALKRMKEATLGRNNVMENNQQIDESALGRLLYNTLHKVFRSTYIKGWEGSYAWEKTPVSKENMDIAYTCIDELLEYYSGVKDIGVDEFKMMNQKLSLQMNVSSAWHKLKRKILGRSDKVEEILNFNKQICNNLESLKTAFNSIISQAKGSDEMSFEVSEARKKSKRQQKNRLFNIQGKSEESPFVSEDDTQAKTTQSADTSKNDNQNDEEIPSVADKVFNFVSDIIPDEGDKNIAKDKISKVFAKTKENEAVELDDLMSAIGDDFRQKSAFTQIIMSSDTATDVLKKIKKEKLSDSATPEEKLYRIIGGVTKTAQTQINMNKENLLDNLYVAENSLDKVVVFLAAFIGNLYNGKLVLGKKDVLKVNIKTVINVLKDIPKMFKVLTSIDTLIRKSSAFGSLQESKSADRSRLDRQLKVMTEKFARLKYAEYKRHLNESRKETGDFLISDIASYNPFFKLNAMRDAVYEDVPTNEADDNANAEDEDAVAPAVPMTAADDTGADPFADAPATGGEEADPLAGGADPTASAAPDAASGADSAETPAGGATASDAGAEGADADTANAGQKNADSEEQKGAEDKYDIGVSRAVNKSSDPLNLTDNEQEQLFTKINLLAKVPDLVNFGKYLYNITPENVDLDDIHYINTLYDLSVKLGLLVDEFEGNNLLDKFDTYRYTVLSKNPEKDLIDIEDQEGPLVSEGSHTVKTEAGDVDVIDAPGMIDAEDVDDYISKLKKQKEEEAEQAEDAHGKLGWMITFCASFYGMPALRTEYFKQVRGMKPEEVAIPVLTKKGYKDISILAIEKVDPVAYLYAQYDGMIRVEDLYTNKYIKKILGESAEPETSVVSESLIDDIDSVVEMFNNEVAADPRLDFSSYCGLSKIAIVKEDVVRNAKPVAEGCVCTVKKGDNTNLSRMLFTDKCRLLCRTMADCAESMGVGFDADKQGEDTIHLTFKGK